MKTTLVCLALFLSACTSACAKKDSPPAATTPTPIQCYVTTAASPFGVSCTGANLGAQVLALDLPTMFAITSTQTIRFVGISNMNWGLKDTPLLLQSCVSITYYDSVTQDTSSQIMKCGANVNT